MTATLVTISGISFSFVTAIEPIPDAVTGSFDLLPQARYKNAKGLLLNKYGQGPFCRFKVPNWTGCQRGLYLVMLADRPVYVGQCNHFNQRWRQGYAVINPRNCFKEGQETNCRVNNLILLSAKAGAIPSLYFHEIADGDLTTLERRLIRELDTVWNLHGRASSMEVAKP